MSDSLSVVIQQLGSSSPTSLLNSSADGLSCICMASLSLSSIILSDLSIIATSSHLIGCCNPQKHVLLWLICWFLLSYKHPCMCSLILVSSLRMVSPIYTFPHEHGTWYTTPELNSVGSLSLTLANVDLKLLPDLNATLISYLLQILLTSSLSPLEYGITTVCLPLSSL